VESRRQKSLGGFDGIVVLAVLAQEERKE